MSPLANAALRISGSARRAPPRSKRSARTTHRARRFGRGLGSSLIVLQVALSLVLLVGAALFGRSLAGLRRIEPGFDRQNLLLFTIRPWAVGYQDAALPRFFEGLREELRRLPDVMNVSLSTAPLPRPRASSFGRPGSRVRTRGGRRHDGPGPHPRGANGRRRRNR